MGAIFRERFGRCRVSLRALVPEEPDQVHIIAVWTREASDLSPGVRMPLRSTTLAQILATGRPEIAWDVRPDDGLLHQILAAEGIHSYASMPLGDTADGAPVLSMSSTQAAAFSHDDLPLVEAIAAIVGTRLSEIAGTTQR